MAYNLLHHRTHLVDLDGIDDEVFRIIIIFFGGFAEAFGDFPDTVVKDVGEPQQQRCLHVAELQLVHHLLDVDRLAVLAGSDLYMSFVVDRKIFKSPTGNVVQFRGIFNSPFSHFFLLCFFARDGPVRL